MQTCRCQAIRIRKNLESTDVMKKSERPKQIEYNIGSMNDDQDYESTSNTDSKRSVGSSQETDK